MWLSQWLKAQKFKKTQISSSEVSTMEHASRCVKTKNLTASRVGKITSTFKTDSVSSLLFRTWRYLVIIYLVMQVNKPVAFYLCPVFTRTVGTSSHKE